MTVKVRELRKGSWYLVVHQAGKRFVRKVDGDKKDAQKAANDLLRELQFRGYAALDGFKPKASGALTVKAFASRWLDEVKTSGLSLSTLNSYRSNVERHIEPVLGEIPIADLTYSRVKDLVQDKLEGTYKRGKNGVERRYSRDTIRLIVATLRAICGEAVREGLLETNPVAGTGRLYGSAKKLRDDPDPMSLDELRQFEVAVQEKHRAYYELVMFLSRTGARVGEAIALQWADVDFDKHEALIRRTMPIHRQVGRTKTPSSNRSVDLSPELVGQLRILQATRRACWLSRGCEMPEWVFATDTGEAPDYSNIRRIIVRACRKAGIRERRPHDLRHTYASVSLSAGRPLTYVSRQLGHRSPQVTLQVYARWVPGQDSGRADLMDSTTTGRQQTATGGVDEL